MEIKMLQDFGGKTKGQILKVSTTLGASLIKKGIATKDTKEEAKQKKEKTTKAEE